MKGFGDQTKSKKKLNHFRTKQYHQQIMNEAVKLHSAGNFLEAKKYYHMLIQNGVEDPNVFNNYGIILVNIGELKEAELSIRKAIELNPKDPSAYANLGGILINIGKLKEAELSIRKAIELNPNYADAHYMLGNILKDLDNLEDAEFSIRKAIELNPRDSSAHTKLGGIFLKLGKFKDAELSIRKAIGFNPDNADAHYILGNILKDQCNLEEAEIFTRKAIKLNPNFYKSYLTLGIILRDQGELEEAEIFTRKAIKLNPNFYKSYLTLGIILRDQGKLKEAKIFTQNAIKLNPNEGNAHLSLGIILRDQGELEEAEISTQNAIKLNSTELALCYQNLSLLMYAKGKKDIAFENIEKAFSINPKCKDNIILRSIMRKLNKPKINDIPTHTNTLIHNSNSSSYPIILNKPVDPKLVNSLYRISALDLNRFKDPSYGMARGSDYELFEDNENITTILEKDLTEITQKIVNSDVFFRDSFFTILSGKSVVRKHNHLVPLDKFIGLNLWKQKYSLVYYLSIGDQDCQNPGILKFYKNKEEINSNKEILPCEGMLVIFPADRYHSVKYDGNKDRVIIGVNFYSF